MTDSQRLAMCILDIQYYDDKATSATRDVDRQAAYSHRNRLVFSAISLAMACGIPAGVRIDHDEPEWPVAIIELPTGQVSWHLAKHPIIWDGHTTEQKYGRMLRFVADALMDNQHE